MTTTVMTSKGQVVIPSETRKHFNLKAGIRLCVIEEGSRIILQPLNREYFEAMAGIAKSDKSLVKELLDERAKEKEREDKKWSK